MEDNRLKELVDDLSMEIIYGCDRFDKQDVERYIISYNISREKLSSMIREKIVSDDPKGESWDEPFLSKAISYWVDKR